jgi:hypothetical protein
MPHDFVLDKKLFWLVFAMKTLQDLFPKYLIVPEVGVIMPAKVFSNVDLPEPFAPTRAINSPCFPSAEIF